MSNSFGYLDIILLGMIAGYYLAIKKHTGEKPVIVKNLSKFC